MPSQPGVDSLIRIGRSSAEFVFVFYLHSERRGLFFRLAKLFGKGLPFPDDLAFGA